MSDVSGVRPNYQPPPDSGGQNPRDVDSKLRDEIRTLNETHRAEIDKLRDENKKRIDAVHDEENAKLNEKDVQHQKEIETLRAMYNKQRGQT